MAGKLVGKRGESSEVGGEHVGLLPDARSSSHTKVRVKSGSHTMRWGGGVRDWALLDLTVARC